MDIGDDRRRRGGGSDRCMHGEHAGKDEKRREGEQSDLKVSVHNYSL